MIRPRHVIAMLAALCIVPARVDAHIGSPDVFVDTHAGAYRVFVTVRPPRAVPGVADVEILIPDAVASAVRIAPMPLTGPGAQFAPAPDAAIRSPDDGHLFTGHLWMMSAGAWQVRVTVEGDQGAGVAAVPVPTLPETTLQMSRPLGVALFALMLLLASGFIGIVSALAREAPLAPGEAPDRRARRRGRVAGAIAACVVVVIVVLGNRWWSVEAANYSRYVYRPLTATTAVSSDGVLALTLHDPGWIALRRLDDIIPDHGHMMHLFVVTPELDRFWHLHPDEGEAGAFTQPLPAMPRGTVDLFADVVHATGISETVTAPLDAAANSGDHPLHADDSAWAMTDAVDGNSARLAGGGRMVWVRDAQPLQTRKLTMFTFRVEDADGKPATDLELYMGMPGHAVFVRRDRRVFAHVHPSGSAPMAAMEIGERALAASSSSGSPMDHAQHAMALPATVSFPYGFPEPGDYRIFVQVRRAAGIETGAFDAHVE